MSHSSAFHLVGKSIDGSGDINQESRRNQNDHNGNSMGGGLAATGEHPEADLDDVDHWEHQEEAAHHGPDGWAQHAEAQHLEVDVGPEGVVHVLAVEEVEGQLQALRHQRREQEEAEGHHLEDKELLGGVDAGVAGGAVLEAALARGGEGKPNEHRDGEERVHVHQAVEGRHVDARGGRRGWRGGYPCGLWVRVVILWVLVWSVNEKQVQGLKKEGFGLSYSFIWTNTNFAGTCEPD